MTLPLAQAPGSDVLLALGVAVEQARQVAAVDCHHDIGVFHDLAVAADALRMRSGERDHAVIVAIGRAGELHQLDQRLGDGGIDAEAAADDDWKI